MRCAPDADDHELLEAFAMHATSAELCYILEWLTAWQSLRFSSCPVGKLLAQILEKLKAAHRTRADGWGAWKVAVSLMR